MSKPEGGMLRQYIPAKLEDNPHLDAEDYEGKLQGLGSPELVKAMRHGDWNIVAGAFFDILLEERHKLPAFVPPAHWTRYRSVDWGSAKPFSVGWWVIAEPGEFVKFSDGKERMFPAGALIRYREWYGCEKDADGRSKPDKGLRLSAEAFGQFMKGVPAPMTIGTCILEDGSKVHGFSCEPIALEGATDITEFGGWRAYLKRT
jgi:hypothetical protein